MSTCPGYRVFLRIRWIREAANTLLPVAQLGGNLVGIRLLAQRRVRGVLAAAGTVLDLTIEALSQFLVDPGRLRGAGAD